MKTRTRLALAVALALTSAGALSQTAPSEPLEQSPGPQPAPGVEGSTVPGPAPARRPVAAPGPGPVEPFQAGPFLVYPEVVLTGMYDNNVFSTQNNTIADTAVILSPALWVQSNWQRHFFGLHVSADATRYRDETAENTEDYRLSAEGRYDFGTDANIYGGARIAREHEDRESPDSRNGTEPTIFKATRAYAGAFRQFGRLSVRAAANAVTLDFNDVPFVTGSGVVNIINNDDRDRDQIGAGVRVGYELTPRVVPFVQLSTDKRHYKRGADDLGYQRSSDGTRGVVGVRTFSPGVFKLEAFAGSMSQDYDDARLNDVGEPTLGMNLVWNATERTTVSVFMDRTIEETTVSIAGTVPQPASAYVNTYVQANLNYAFTPRFSTYVFGSASNADYEGIFREDDYYTAGIGWVYRVAKSFFVDVTLQKRKLQSSVPSEDFHRSQAFLRLAFPFSR